MTVSKRSYVLPTVAIVETTCSCAACGHALGAAAGSWKTGALRRELALAKAGGVAYETGYSGVLLRQFICPGCATLLDTETATESDPFLDDRLKR